MSKSNIINSSLLRRDEGSVCSNKGSVRCDKGSVRCDEGSVCRNKGSVRRDENTRRDEGLVRCDEAEATQGHTYGFVETKVDVMNVKRYRFVAMKTMLVTANRCGLEHNSSQLWPINGPCSKAININF